MTRTALALAAGLATVLAAQRTGLLARLGRGTTVRTVRPRP
ncbi:hypothetical protein ACFFTK_20375 [Pseudonocardia petroleophila]|nr:hypothetical protein [Pseudonocardia petroleophila]